MWLDAYNFILNIFISTVVRVGIVLQILSAVREACMCAIPNLL